MESKKWEGRWGPVGRAKERHARTGRAQQQGFILGGSWIIPGEKKKAEKGEIPITICSLLSKMSEENCMRSGETEPEVLILSVAVVC